MFDDDGNPLSEEEIRTRKRNRIEADLMPEGVSENTTDDLIEDDTDDDPAPTPSTRIDMTAARVSMRRTMSICSAGTQVMVSVRGGAPSVGQSAMTATIDAAGATASR